MDPTCRETVHPDRWKQIVREGDAAPAWLAENFGADRRRATLLAYLIDLQERLTDEAIHMFCKQIGRLFARAAAACEERHKSGRKETTAALRLFRDTLRVLMEANANNGDAIEMLRAKVGWRMCRFTLIAETDRVRHFRALPETCLFRGIQIGTGGPFLYT